jgi:putative transposase
MRGPQPTSIVLTAEERGELDALVRRRTAPQQLVLRARIILAAADGRNNAQIARHLQVSLDRVRRWRARWLGLRGVPLTTLDVAERLGDAPRPGRPVRISAAQVCQLVRLACEAPSTTGRPITEWTGRELADEVVRRGIVAAISPRHASRLVKRGGSNRIACVPG